MLYVKCLFMLILILQPLTNKISHCVLKSYIKPMLNYFYTVQCLACTVLLHFLNKVAEPQMLSWL